MNITRGIKNLIKWRKVIWEDNDADFNSIYSLMEFKLKNIYEDLKSAEFESDITDKVKECINLAHRIANEATLIEHWNYKEKRLTAPFENILALQIEERKKFWEAVSSIDDWMH